MENASVAQVPAADAAMRKRTPNKIQTNFLTDVLLELISARPQKIGDPQERETTMRQNIS